MAELVPGHPDRLAGLVAQVDLLLPPSQLGAEHGVRVRLCAVALPLSPGKSHGLPAGQCSRT